ncbi:YcxB family protein [Streptomyces sp. NPDC048340]|uniref:YcxB family protein n=1 Tax=Streptomyces sp. NPDC048340 TaxID=3365537 RepID=UPI003722E1C2
MDTTGRAVELYCAAERRDVREVLRWRAFGAPFSRVRLLIRLLLVPLVAPVIIVAQHGRQTYPAGLALAAGAGVLCGALGLLYDRWRAARPMYAWAAAHPEYRCVVAEAGMRSHRPDGTAVAYRWGQYRGWTETPNLFLFVFYDGELGWLPKRAASDPADIGRIRAVFGRNLTRIG